MTRHATSHAQAAPHATLSQVCGPAQVTLQGPPAQLSM